MRKVVLSFFAIVFFAGCSSGMSERNAIPTATPEPVPPTSTPIPLSELDLEPLLIQAGDLPAGLSGAQVRDDPPMAFKDVPSGDNMIWQQFQRGQDPAGYVAVFVYEDAAQVDQAYEAMKDMLVNGHAEESQDVGDRLHTDWYSSMFSESMGGIDSAHGVFTHCHAAVFIQFHDTTDVAAVSAYAKRLDARLEPLICP